MHSNTQNKPADATIKGSAVKAGLVKKKSSVIGIVTNCMRLNVREAPYANAKTLASIPALSKVVLENSDCDNSFYKVRTEEGVQGFCLKKFITIRH